MLELQSWINLQESIIYGMVQSVRQLGVGADIEKCNLPIDRSWGEAPWLAEFKPKPVPVPKDSLYEGSSGGKGSPAWDKSLILTLFVISVYNVLF